MVKAPKESINITKDEYFQKKLAENEEKANIPNISVIDMALIGAISLFLIGSFVIWLFFPGKLTYTSNSPGEKGKPEAVDSNWQQKILNQENTEQLFEEITDEDLDRIETGQTTPTETSNLEKVNPKNQPPELDRNQVEIKKRSVQSVVFPPAPAEGDKPTTYQIDADLLQEPIPEEPPTSESAPSRPVSGEPPLNKE